MSYLSLTSWSLHRSLGPLYLTEWDRERMRPVTKEVSQPALIALTELPQLASSQGIKGLDICHFHFPDTADDYLQRLRAAIAQANVQFDTLLVDYGDISSADVTRRAADVHYIEGWIDIAQKVGAQRVRVVAGESPATDQPALQRSAEALSHLIAYADTRGVGVITENFRALASTADNCLFLLTACSQELGFIADFGNFPADRKLAELSRVLPAAIEVHAKGHYDEHGLPDEAELHRCLALLAPAQYDGPITLVYDGPGDEWAGINRVKAIVTQYL